MYLYKKITFKVYMQGIKIKNYIIILVSFIIIYNNLYEPICLNSDNIDLEILIKIVEKFLNEKNVFILNENEKLIAQYWNQTLYCPFSKLMSHGLTKEEALLIIDFFKIEDIGDLEKLKNFIKNFK